MPARQRPPEGVETFRFAGVTIALQSPDVGLREQARLRYRGFETTERPALTVRHVPGGEVTGRVRQEIVRERRGGSLALRGDGFTAALDVGSGDAVLHCGTDVGPLDALVRCALPLLLEDGALLHGCALSLGGRGVLCCGPSGAGKSTLAGLMPEHALCDELAAVRATDGGFRLDALPFWHGRPASVPLRAIVLLRHAGAGRHELVRCEAGARRLLEHVVWPEHWPDRLARCFDLVARMAAAVPIYDLAFLPRPDVRAALEEAAA